MLPGFVLHESEPAASMQTSVKGTSGAPSGQAGFRRRGRMTGASRLIRPNFFEPQRPDERVGDAYVASLSDGAGCPSEAPAADPRWACQEWQARCSREDFIAPYRCDFSITRA